MIFVERIQMSSKGLLFFVLLGLASTANCQQYAGDRCTTDGQPGTCKVLPDCLSVYDELTAGKELESLCGFSNYDPIVCCPNDPSKKTTPAPPKLSTMTRTVTRKPVKTDGRVGSMARAKCAEYAEEVYQLVYPQSLDVNPQPKNTSVCGIKNKKLIVGGSKAGPMEFPHMTAIGFNAGDEGIQWSCGGTLVSNKFVLTAAHCTWSPDWGRAVKVRVGDLNLVKTDDNAEPQERDIVECIKHPRYKGPAEYDDIALLKLNKPVKFDAYVRPACLPYSNPDVTIPGDKALATGWGDLEWGAEEGSPDLMKVTLSLVDYATCDASFPAGLFDVKLNKGILPQTQICAGGYKNDTCPGDSGGPLQVFNNDQECMYTVVGVTSLGSVCGSNNPGIYTRVQYYMRWLEATIWPDGI